MENNACSKTCPYLPVFAFHREMKPLVIRVSAALTALIISA